MQRILHQRAMDVKLDPALQDKCMIDLGKWCSEKTETGQVLYTEQPCSVCKAGWVGRAQKGEMQELCVAGYLFRAKSVLKMHAA